MAPGSPSFTHTCDTYGVPPCWQTARRLTVAESSGDRPFQGHSPKVTSEWSWTSPQCPVVLRMRGEPASFDSILRTSPGAGAGLVTSIWHLRATEIQGGLAACAGLQLLAVKWGPAPGGLGHPSAFTGRRLGAPRAGHTALNVLILGCVPTFLS